MRTNLYLLAIALLLLIPVSLRYCGQTGAYLEMSEAPRLFRGFTPDRVAAIKIFKMDVAAMDAAREKAAVPGQAKAEPEEPILKASTMMVRKADKWQVLWEGQVEYPAAQNLVEDLLNKLRDVPANRTDIVSEDKGRHEEYEVDEKHAVHLIAADKDGKELAYLLVGRKPKTDPGSRDYTAGQGVFVRDRNLPQVIHYNASYWTVEADANHWLDKNLLTMERDKVQSLEVVNPKGRWVAERDKTDKTKWRLKEPVAAPAKAGDVDAIVNYLSSLYMDSLVGPRTAATESQYALGTGARYLITAHLDDGQTKHTLRVGENNPEKEGQVFAALDDKPYVVTIGKYIVETFRKTVEDVRDAEAEKKELEAASQPASGPAASQPASGPAPAASQPSEAGQEQPK